MSEIQYLAAIGKRGGLASRRVLTRSHAKKRVAIREAKQAVLKTGKPLPPRDRKLLKIRLRNMIYHNTLIMRAWRPLK